MKQTATTKAVTSSAKTSRGNAAKSPDVVAGVVISNGDKVLYPEAGITKRDLARVLRSDRRLDRAARSPGGR